VVSHSGNHCKPITTAIPRDQVLSRAPSRPCQFEGCIVIWNLTLAERMGLRMQIDLAGIRPSGLLHGDASSRLVPRRPEPHRASLEWLRLVACLGIVWFHCKGPGAVIGYGGLAALIGLSVGLASVPGTLLPFTVILRKRGIRLLVPWIFWCVVYTIWRLIGAIALSKSIGNEFHGWMLLVGPAIHLWYLPFAFGATCFAALLSRHQSSPKFAVFWMACAAAAFLVCSYRLSRHTIGIPWAQWTFGLPAVFIGLALPQFGDQRHNCRGLAALMLTIAMSSAVAWLSGWNALALPYLVGTAGLAGAWLLTMPASPFTASLCSLSYGIYLVHPFFASLIGQAIGTRSGASLAILVVVVSVVFVAMARRGPLRMVM
jgi:surface polysaccharide O-acyltransferase-like enzyme